MLSHIEFINVHILHAFSLPDHPLRVTEKATHGKLVSPTLSSPRGDKYYNQYRPLCEVCPRDHGKVVGSRQGAPIDDSDQPAHPHSLTRDFDGGSIGSRWFNVSSGGKLRH